MPKSQYNRTRFFLHKLKNFAGSLKTNKWTNTWSRNVPAHSVILRSCLLCCNYSEEAWEKFSEHYTGPQNPFKIELNKSKDKIILLNPLGIVMGLILDCDSQPRISLTTQIIMILNALPLSGNVVFRAEMVDPDRAAFMLKSFPPTTLVSATAKSWFVFPSLPPNS